MPLSNPFANRRIVEAVKAIREHPDAAYGIAIGLVAFATLTRWAMGDYIGAHIPFITFFPAIIIGALLGGVWPGVCATILAVLAAWYRVRPVALVHLLLRHQSHRRCRRERIDGPRSDARRKRAYPSRLRACRHSRGRRAGQYQAGQCQHGETVRLQPVRTLGQERRGARAGSTGRYA